MTFSICVYDPNSGQVGVGALTGTLGVGKLVSHAQARVGATENAQLAEDPIRPDTAEVAEQRADWLDAWTELYES